VVLGIPSSVIDFLDNHYGEMFPTRDVLEYLQNECNKQAVSNLLTLRLWSPHQRGIFLFSWVTDIGIVMDTFEHKESSNNTGPST